MKKTLFIATIIAASFFFSSTSNAQEAPPKQDTATRIDLQFVKELNGNIYTIMVVLFPYNGHKNDVLVLKRSADPKGLEISKDRHFFLAPSVKNLQVSLSEDKKRLVILYDYGQEKMTIELE